MDLRTLFLAQTCALAATAAMLWGSRGDADRRNGLRTWTFAITSQAIAYFTLSQTPWLPAMATALIGNFAGALSVALFFAAIREFAGRGYNRALLAVMVAVVTVAGGVAAEHYVAATIFNGFAYSSYEWLNAHSLWCAEHPASRRMQRVVAVFYVAMGIELPARAIALLATAPQLRYLDAQASWQEPIYLFGFVYIIVTTLGFVLMCKARAEAETRAQARTDELTGLPNRRALDEAITIAFTRAEHHGRPFAIVMADVDRFKVMNDTFGHAAGDSILASFAGRLRDALRACDRTYRYGGEEFRLVLPDTDAAAAHALAEHARMRVELPASARMHALTASFGVAAWQPGDAVDSLFGRADRALYRAKKSGRNRVEVE